MKTDLVPPTIPTLPETLTQICQIRLKAFLSREGVAPLHFSPDQLIERLTKIISQNYASGRLKRVILWQKPSAITSSDASPSSNANNSLLEEYIDRVIDCLLKEYQRVEKLSGGDTAEWTRLYGELLKRAEHFLLRQTSARKQDAADFVQETCLAIFNSPFPYDVSFDAWATKILLNFILRRYTRSQDLIDRNPDIVSLDRPCQYETSDQFSLYDLLMDEVGTAAFGQVEVQDWLLQAIFQLHSPTQQRVIIDTIFNSLSDEQIAQGLGKTKNAVHILRHRALHQLKHFLEE